MLVLWFTAGIVAGPPADPPVPGSGNRGGFLANISKLMGR